MKMRFATVMAGAATLTMTGAMLLVGAGAANAAAPPFEGTDPNEIGTLAFYNSSGTQITSGSITDAPIAAYTVASSADAGHTKATLYFYTPKNGIAPSAWTGEQSSLSTTYPNTSAPAPINGEGSNPVVTGAATDEDLSDYIADNPNTDTSTTDGYAGLYQVRVKTGTSGTYWSSDISVSGSTWTQVFPAVASSTQTSLTSSENPSTSGDNVTFTATESSGATHQAGSVQFSVDGTNSGSPVPVSGSGVATFATSTLAVGTHAVKATFTPTDTADFSGSFGTVSQVVQAAKTPTTTTLTISGNTTTGTAATLSGSVSQAGSVSFFDGSSTTALGTTTVTTTGGGPYTFSLPGGFAAGSHSVVAKFTPTDTADFNSSQSQPVTFITSTPATGACAATGSACSDTQTIQGEIPPGTLVISTPYTDTKPLDVGTLALSSDGTFWTGHATFQCITVTDMTSGGSPFAASAEANQLSQVPGSGNPSQPATAVTTINPENVGLSQISKSTAACPDGSTPVNSYNGSVSAQDNNAANGVPVSDPGSAGLGGGISHPVLGGSAGGEGTATYDGVLTLNAPTSTASGTYTGTILFTVSD
ncbi:MAG TPA: Ig-like domain-containing protein [Mycobacteriales bacterium]|jgi:hypothetical protein|nr:Ig-like domain-containing protein [Mycobacteriales bacterium]